MTAHVTAGTVKPSLTTAEFWWPANYARVLA